MTPELTEFSTILIATFSLIIAFVTFLSRSKKESGEQDAHNAKVIAKLDFIGEDVKDIKAEQRSFRTEINEIRSIATHASERAEAAHHRLDRAGLDIKEYHHSEEK